MKSSRVFAHLVFAGVVLGAVIQASCSSSASNESGAGAAGGNGGTGDASAGGSAGTGARGGAAAGADNEAGGAGNTGGAAAGSSGSGDGEAGASQAGAGAGAGEAGAGGSSDCTMCGGACVDLTTSVANCGSCGHVCGCGSTSCTDGVCDAHVLAPSQGAPVAIALHAGTLYWGNDADRTVSTVPIAGGSPSVLYPGRTAVRGFAFDDTRVYFTRNVFNIVEAGLLDGSSSGNFTNQQEPGATGIASNASAAYWTNGGSGAIRTRSLGAPAASGGTTLISGQLHPDGIALDATALYWANHDASNGEIVKMPIAGGPSTPVASGRANPHSVVVASGYVYWTEQGDGTPNTGSVQRAPVDSDGDAGAITTFADHQPMPSAIAVDASNVYWTDSVAGRIMRAPLSGGAALPVGINEATPMGLVVTPTCLYFADFADGNVGTGSIRSHDLQ
jgi:hypothetical protein